MGLTGAMSWKRATSRTEISPCATADAETVKRAFFPPAPAACGPACKRPASPISERASFPAGGSDFFPGIGDLFQSSDGRGRVAELRPASQSRRR